MNVLLLTLLLSGHALQSPAQAAAQLSGSYYFGDGLGVNCSLELKKDDTFAFRWTGCLGVYDENRGKVTRDGDVIVLHPEKPNVQEGFKGTPTRFIPVKWGDRQYLISEAEMLGFCHRVAMGWSGDEPLGRNVTYYLKFDSRQGASRKLGKLSSKPEVPAGYREILEGGFVAKVLRPAGADKVVIDKGRLDRVVVGIKLAPAASWDWVSVVSVGDHESICKVWSKWDKPPVPGSKLFPEGF
jgi:hypothetical protein